MSRAIPGSHGDWFRLATGALLCIGHPADASAQAREDAQGPTDWPTVIARLRQQASQQPDRQPLRQQLAIAYNNYGVSLGDQGQWGQAAGQLHEALRLDGSNEHFRTNLTSLYLNQAGELHGRHQLNEAAQVLEKAIALDPASAQTYTMLGEIEYARQKLSEAKRAWQRALELDPSQAQLKRRLEQVTQELPVESQFERISQTYFDLRYEERLDRPVGFDIRDALFEARRVIGADFACWPKQKIVVLIYSAESFRALRPEIPHWVAGQFDGKIRVPLPDAQLGQDAVKQILFHEYTHAVVHELTGGACPVWLNEGLAEYEGRRQTAGSLERLARAHATRSLIPWLSLSDRISISLPAEEVRMAYEQSYTMARYLIDRYSFWRMRRVLKALSEGDPWQEVFTREFRRNLSRLEGDWREWIPELLTQRP